MLKIYNSLTNKVELFRPIHSRKINMYVCGPTVYDHIHIGNARPVIFFDTVKKYLKSIGFDVKYVTNITDVDDKIIEKAIKKQVTEKEISEKYTASFLEMVKALNADSINLTPKATDYITQMIHYIQDLVDQGYAYVIDSGVYFRVHKIPTYGQLSKQNIETLRQNTRKELDDQKESPEDFALWKTTTEGITYDSPWQKGRPGWHTECAVMNLEIFNQEIDIHGGGFDLKFPHHENEIAQTCAHQNHELAKYWMHVGRLDLEQTKMSKSLGNALYVKDLIKKVDPNAFRLLIISHHYRQPINYSEELMEQYVKIYERINRTMKKTAFNLQLNGIIENGIHTEYYQEFTNLMENDFSTPNVLTLIENILKKMNSESNLEQTAQLKNTVEDILSILGIEIDTQKVSDEIIQTYLEWQEARETRDFKKADELRKILVEQGLI